MKCSHVVLVSCIAGPTLISALPHNGTRAITAAQSLRTTAGTALPKKSTVKLGQKERLKEHSHKVANKLKTGGEPISSSRKGATAVSSPLKVRNDGAEDQSATTIRPAAGKNGKSRKGHKTRGKGKKSKGHSKGSNGHAQSPAAPEMPVARGFFDGELSARDYGEALETRFWWHPHFRKGKKDKNSAQSESTPASTSPTPPTTPVSREVFEDVLEARDLEDGIEAREIEDDLEAREIEDDFEVRGIHPRESIEDLELRGNTLGPRDFDENLESRNFFEDSALVSRDIYDDDDALAARSNFFDSLSAVAKTFNPKQGNTPVPRGFEVDELD